VDKAKRKIDEAKRKKRAKQAEKNVIWPEKGLLQAIESIAFLIGEERVFSSPKKQPNKKTPLPSTIGLKPPVFAPAELSSSSEDPERLRDKEPKEGKLRAKKASPGRPNAMLAEDNKIVSSVLIVSLLNMQFEWRMLVHSATKNG